MYPEVREADQNVAYDGAGIHYGVQRSSREETHLSETSWQRSSEDQPPGWVVSPAWLAQEGHIGGCQNYGPFFGTLDIRCRIIIGIQKGTIILPI